MMYNIVILTCIGFLLVLTMNIRIILTNDKIFTEKTNKKPYIRRKDLNILFT